MKNKWVSTRKRKTSDDSVSKRASKPKLRSISNERFESKLLECEINIKKGLPSESEKILLDLKRNRKLTPEQNVKLQTLFSQTYETQGLFDKSAKVIKGFENDSILGKLKIESRVSTMIQLAISYANLDEVSTAESILNKAIEEVSEPNLELVLGDAYLALARVNKKAEDFPQSFENAERGLNQYREVGSQPGMVRAYYYMGVASLMQGDNKKALQDFELATKLAGKHASPMIMGRVYTELSAVYWNLNRPKKGVTCIDTSIALFSQTEDKVHQIFAYNNLGVLLTLLGDWNRARAALKHSLELALDINHEHIAGIYESFGELEMLQGELKEAESLLLNGIKVSRELNNDGYLIQNLCTMASVELAKGEFNEAIKKAEETIEISEKIGAEQFINLAALVKADAYLELDEPDKSRKELKLVETNYPESDFFILGSIQRIKGLIAKKKGDTKSALNHFRRFLTISETREALYCIALSHYFIGDVLAESDVEEASKHLISATEIFRKLEVEKYYKSAEDKIEKLEESDEENDSSPEANSVRTQLLMQRLAEATASRELLFRELVAILQQESNAEKIIIAESDDEKKFYPFITHGYSPTESNRLTTGLVEATVNDGIGNFSKTKNVKVFPLRSPNASPATLMIYPKYSAVLNNGNEIKPLLRIVELGMDVCALRESDGEETEKVEEYTSPFTSQSLMPGFIHSSPAMTALVEEVYKIRTSDVSVLITGESGTGKELVSRAIHAVSNRKDQAFIPFNCTAVPKELAEGHLFGYKKGAFTGAVSDSPGVIRSADGGTLLLDEIGDLPIDIQPKLLRFLQEGEVHPIGDKKPIEVDVRIIAATNMDLEQRVQEGLFREDLYYRINVIRLRVPPLRERRTEVKPIVKYYINQYSARFNKSDITIKPQALDLLMVYNWDGNVRQLCNEVQRIVARAESGEVITPKHLSSEIRSTTGLVAFDEESNVKPIMSQVGAVGTSAVGTQGLTIEEAVSDLETEMIIDALRRHDGNITRVANELGLTRRGLYLKIERYEIKKAS